MTKFSFFTVLITLISFISTNNIIPQADSDLLKGFLDGSGLNSYLNIQSCQSDFNSFFNSTFAIFQGVLDNNNINIMFNAGQAMTSYSSMMKNCELSKDKINVLEEDAIKAIMDPKDFLLGALNRMVSIHVVAEYWGLKGNIKSGKFYEVGKTLGDIITYVVKNGDTTNNNELAFLEK